MTHWMMNLQTIFHKTNHLGCGKLKPNSALHVSRDFRLSAGKFSIYLLKKRIFHSQTHIFRLRRAKTVFFTAGGGSSRCFASVISARARTLVSIYHTFSCIVAFYAPIMKI